jgi:hypothetical protein
MITEMAKITTALKETNIGQAIQQHAAALPRNYYLWGGLGLLGASVALHLFNRKQAGRVLGQLASPILMMAMYKTNPDSLTPGNQSNSHSGAF